MQSYDVVYTCDDDSYETVEDASSIGELAQRIMARLSAQLFIDINDADSTHIVRCEDVTHVRLEEIGDETDDESADLPSFIDRAVS